MSQPRSLETVCTSGLRFGTLSAMFVGALFDLRDAFLPLQETRLVYGLMSFLHSSHEELTHTFMVKVGGRVARAV